MIKMTYVGIGASAGGLEALQKLLQKLPKRSDFVYIIIQHMGTDHKSKLADILSKSTDIPVVEPKCEERLEGGKIYVIPPKHTLLEDSGVMIVKEVLGEKAIPNSSIDDIFISLAKSNGESTVGIILSGTGHDGTKGMAAIRAANGITIAQLPSEAEYNAMPTSAINSDVVDQVLSVKSIGIALAGIAGDKALSEDTTLKAIATLLQENANLDLDKYKPKTILRRIKKRMLLLKKGTLEEYVQYIFKNKEETQLLYQNILIGVTKFFREPEAFSTLKDTLQNYLQNKKNKQELRIWVSACSSGEEAYSIAIIVCELLEQMSQKIDVRIFATDIDDDALKKARAGSYTTEVLQEVSSSLRKKYFTQNNNCFEVSKKLREMIVFTHQNLLKDPPFINMDLISCRNALIYFTPAIQQEIFAMFHYALRDDGILFLGISESASQYQHYFLALNNQWKIYQKEHLNNPPKLPNRFYQTYPHAKVAKEIAEPSQNIYSNIEQAILESIYSFFMPSCIVVNTQNEIIFTKGKVPYLEFGDGFASLNLFKNLHLALHIEVRNILQEASLKKSVAVSRFVEISNISGKHLFVRVVASPFLFENGRYVILLYFQEIQSEEMVYESGSLDQPKESDLITSYDRQLFESKEQLRNLQNELDISSENMQMLHEELQSSNEELQASNEELETSNEELKSSNEELHNTNINIQSLQQQLFKILESTPEGILGIDKEGRHTFVNKAAAKMLGYSVKYLLGKDSHQLWHHTKADGSPFPEAECAVTKVLQTGQEIREESLFWRHDGTAFDVEFVSSPIIEDKNITGTVLFFHDITERKKLKQSLIHEKALLKRYLNIAGVIVIVLDCNANIVFINKKGCEILDAQADEIIGKNWFENYVWDVDLKDVKDTFDLVMQSKMDITISRENHIKTTKREKRLISWKNTLLQDEDGNITGVISTGNDITQEHVFKEQLIQSEKKYAMTFNKANIGIAHLSLEGKLIEVNDCLCDIVGYSKEELLGLSIEDITDPEDINEDIDYIKQLIEKEISSYQTEKRYIHKNQSTVWINLSISLIRDEADRAQYFILIIQDISKMKSMTKKLLEKEELMISQSRQAAMGDMIAMIAHQWRQPITVIAMAVNNLKADIELEEEITTQQLQTMGDDILVQTKHLSQTIDDFRNFFKPNKEKELCSVCSVIDNAMGMMKKSLENNNIAIEINKKCKLEILTFPNELLQVFLNIINNAKDALKDSAKKNARITINVEEDDKFIKIVFCDNGGGIPKDIFARLGEPYVSTKKVSGTGLGIYMSKVIVEKHLLGTLKWQNKDEGACFTIRLPLKN